MNEQKTMYLLHYDNDSDLLMRNFLNIESNYELLKKAREFPSKENISKLNKDFKKYYTELQLIKYISQLINHYSRDFYKKKNKEKYFYIFSLENEDIFDINIVNNKIDENTLETESLLKASSLLEVIENQTIYKALLSLTDKQLLILNLHFIHELRHTEIANKLKVSQQSVSKTIKKSLDKLRNIIVTGDELM